MQGLRERLEAQLDKRLPRDGWASLQLADATRYALLGGGKRIRGILVYAAAQLAGGDETLADVPACAIEMLHAYSLVHDDLPAMDDDDLRRGKPACHKAYDEATAILAGDTLHTMAFQLLATHGPHDPETRIAMIRTLSGAAGGTGMAAGQMQDILARGNDLTVEALEEIHYLKTGRLITAALMLGAQAAQCRDPELLEALKRFGDNIGLAFQIQDDILDVTGCSHKMGKHHGSDARQEMRTFPQLIGMEASRQRVLALCQQASDSIQHQGDGATLLKELAAYLTSRQS